MTQIDEVVLDAPSRPTIAPPRQIHVDPDELQNTRNQLDTTVRMLWCAIAQQGGEIVLNGERFCEPIGSVVWNVQPDGSVRINAVLPQSKAA